MACGGLGGWGRGRLDEDEDDAVSPARARHQSNCQSARARQPPRDDAPPTRDRPPAAPSSSSSQQIERGPVSDRMPSRLFLGARAVAVAHTNTLTCMLEDACPPGYDRSLVNRARGRHTTQLCPDTVVGLCPLWNLYGSFMAVSCQSPALAA